MLFSYDDSKNYATKHVEFAGFCENAAAIKKASFALVIAVAVDYFYRPISNKTKPISYRGNYS